MTDKFSKIVRSRVMSKINSRNTKPEKLVRCMMHSLGYRFRLHDKNLPGKPDIVLKKYQVAVFVNGCFWHQHKGCSKAAKPKSNNEYWDKKLSRNSERDLLNMKALKSLGWKCFVVWECETRTPEILKNKISIFMEW